MLRTDSARARLLRLALWAFALISAGLLYALFIRATGLGIPCIFHTVTGLDCPGCGVSRMCLALLRLDFKTAWSSNPAVMALLPLFGAVAADMSVRYVRTGKAAEDGFCRAALIFSAAVLTLFGVLRNII